MPIRVQEAPSRSVATVEATLSRLLAEPEFERRANLAAPLSDVPLSLSTPHQVFTVEVNYLLERGLSAARPTETRFIVLQGEKVLGSAETRLVDGTPGPFANVAQGAEVEGFVDALRQAEALDDVAGSDFELRTLRINELHVTAIWLRGTDRDLIVPAAPSPEPFTPGRPFRAEEFVQMVAEVARSIQFGREPVEG